MTVRQSQSSALGMTDRWWAPGLLTVAAIGWWWSIRSARAMIGVITDDMHMGAATMTFAGFLVAWVAMMGTRDVAATSTCPA